MVVTGAGLMEEDVLVGIGREVTSGDCLELYKKNISNTVTEMLIKLLYSRCKGVIFVLCNDLGEKLSVHVIQHQTYVRLKLNCAC